MKFSQAIRTVYRDKYFFEGNGRASRSEYWWNQIPLTIYITLGQAAVAFKLTRNEPFAYALLAFSLILIPPLVGLSVRRLHDLNLSGWWFLVMVLLELLLSMAEPGDYAAEFPLGAAGMVYYIINAVYMVGLIALFARKGTAGTNRFGSDPLAEITGRL